MAVDTGLADSANLVLPARAALATAFAPGGLMDQCLPSFLEELAVAVPLEGGGSYRLADGGFTENNGVAFTLAQMQRACAPPADAAVDCEAMPTMVIVDHSPAKKLKMSPPKDLDILFASYPDPSQGVDFPAWRAVPATVFDGELPLPTSDDWIVYEKESASVFYAAELTTVENKWYGVAAGMRVRALFLRPNLELGGLLQGSIGGGTSTFYGGQMAAWFFENQYAPLAALQAEAAAPVLQAFFDGSTDDPADWVNASFAGERRVEFGSGEFGGGEFDDATNGTNATRSRRGRRRGRRRLLRRADVAVRRGGDRHHILLCVHAHRAGDLRLRGCGARWWNPPFLTGLVGMGDGSTLPNAIEKFLFKSAGTRRRRTCTSFREAENKAASSAPIRIPARSSSRASAAAPTTRSCAPPW